MHSNEEVVARILLFYIDKICNMLWSKVQQSYCYTQLCNYREEFLFKYFGNQLNILCNLSFARSLSASYFEMDGQSLKDWILSKNLPPFFPL